MPEPGNVGLDARADAAPLSLEQKLALHTLWMTRIDTKRRELLGLMGATGALLVAIPLVGSHVTAGSPTAIYFVGVMVMLFGIFLAATITGADYGEMVSAYEADARIVDDRIPPLAHSWRRQIRGLAIGMLALFGLCFFALAAVGDSIKRVGPAAPSKQAEPGAAPIIR